LDSGLADRKGRQRNTTSKNISMHSCLERDSNPGTYLSCPVPRGRCDWLPRIINGYKVTVYYRRSFKGIVYSELENWVPVLRSPKQNQQLPTMAPSSSCVIDTCRSCVRNWGIERGVHLCQLRVFCWLSVGALPTPLSANFG
jgi:hypothetical protein